MIKVFSLLSAPSWLFFWPMSVGLEVGGTLLNGYIHQHKLLHSSPFYPNSKTFLGWRLTVHSMKFTLSGALLACFKDTHTKKSKIKHHMMQWLNFQKHKGSKKQSDYFILCSASWPVIKSHNSGCLYNHTNRSLKVSPFFFFFLNAAFRFSHNFFFFF